jgi:hypothetical protein
LVGFELCKRPKKQRQIAFPVGTLGLSKNLAAFFSFFKQLKIIKFVSYRYLQNKTLQLPDPTTVKNGLKHLMFYNIMYLKDKVLLALFVLYFVCRGIQPHTEDQIYALQTGMRLPM